MKSIIGFSCLDKRPFLASILPYLKWMIVLLCFGVMPFSHAFDLAGLFGFGGDSGSGKVAKLTYRLHDGFTTTSIAWSPTSQLVATAGMNSKIVHIWDIDQQKIIKKINLPPNALPPLNFRALTWSPDGRYLVICIGGPVLILDTSNWEPLNYSSVSGKVGCTFAAFSSDSAQLALRAQDLNILSTFDWHVIKKFKQDARLDKDANGKRFIESSWDFNKNPDSMSFVPNAHILAIGGGHYETDNIKNKQCPLNSTTNTTDYTTNTSGRVWFLYSESQKFDDGIVVYCNPTGGGVSVLAFHPNGKSFATSTNSGKNAYTDSVRVVNRENGKVEGQNFDKLITERPSSITYTPNGKFLLVGIGGIDKEPIYIIDANALQLVDTLHSPSGTTDLAVNSNSTMFASAIGSGFYIWKFVR